HASFNPSPSLAGQPELHAGKGPTHVEVFPVRGTYCELFFSEISSLALRAPTDDVLNEILMAILWPGATVTGRLKPSVSLKLDRSCPDIEMSVITSGPVPKLVTVSVACGNVVPSSW